MQATEGAGREELAGDNHTGLDALAIVFSEDMIALLVCLKYYYFLCQCELLS